MCRTRACGKLAISRSNRGADTAAPAAQGRGRQQRSTTRTRRIVSRRCYPVPRRRPPPSLLTHSLTQAVVLLPPLLASAGHCPLLRRACSTVQYRSCTSRCSVCPTLSWVAVVAARATASGCSQGRESGAAARGRQPPASLYYPIYR
jgi:hypothetical protein